MTEEDAPCDVCKATEVAPDNQIIFCDKCNIGVHQICYGVEQIPSGSWFCKACNKGIKPICIFCRQKEGAMKNTVDGRWAHVSCTLWIPETNFGNPETMDNIQNVDKIPKSRWALSCFICRVKGGACIQCYVPSCRTAYHVTCGYNNGLHMKMEDIVTSETDIQFESFCRKHTQNLSSGNLNIPKKKRKSTEDRKNSQFPPNAISVEAKTKEQRDSEFRSYIEGIKEGMEPNHNYGISKNTLDQKSISATNGNVSYDKEVGNEEETSGIRSETTMVDSEKENQFLVNKTKGSSVVSNGIQLCTLMVGKATARKSFPAHNTARGTITKNVQETVPNELQERVHNNVQKEVRNNVQEVRNNVQEEVRNNVQEEVRNNVQEEVRNNVPEEVPKKAHEILSKKFQEIVRNKAQEIVVNEVSEISSLKFLLVEPNKGQGTMVNKVKAIKVNKAQGTASNPEEGIKAKKLTKAKRLSDILPKAVKIRKPANKPQAKAKVIKPKTPPKRKATKSAATNSSKPSPAKAIKLGEQEESISKLNHSTESSGTVQNNDQEASYVVQPVSMFTNYHSSFRNAQSSAPMGISPMIGNQTSTSTLSKNGNLNAFLGYLGTLLQSLPMKKSLRVQKKIITQVLKEHSVSSSDASDACISDDSSMSD